MSVYSNFYICQNTCHCCFTFSYSHLHKLITICIAVLMEMLIAGDFQRILEIQYVKLYVFGLVDHYSRRFFFCAEQFVTFVSVVQRFLTSHLDFDYACTLFPFVCYINSGELMNFSILLSKGVLAVAV